MQREIKFRAWCKNYMSYQGTPDLETLQSFIYHYGNEKLMQYTGLKDKNGKEIYEGDILEDKESMIYIVEYTGCEFVKNNKQFTSNLIKSLAYLKIEVIGNIYENPELIRAVGV